MKMASLDLIARRTFLASLGLAASLHAAGSSRIRAGCLVTPDSFDALLTALRDIQRLGYSGYSTTMRVLQTQSGQMEEVRAQLSEIALDLIGVRATLPHYGELGVDRALEEVARLAMAARQFGARTLILHSAGLGADGRFKPEDLDAKAKFFDQSAKRCKETGVIFIYRTQESEFLNDAAEIAGLIGKTDKNTVYYDLDLASASRAHAGAIAFFRDNPSRVFAMEAPFGDPQFKVHELAAAVKHTKWISWLIEAAPSEASRGVMKKAFGV